MPVVDRSNEAIQDNPAQLRVMREEIFGAILPVKTYDPLEEAIGFVNDGERPLVVYVFSKDERSLSRRCSSPPRVVRARPSSLSTAPCPRCRSAASATARSTATHGIEGFREFSNPRGVHSGRERPHRRLRRALRRADEVDRGDGLRRGG
jgi:coniferyl-aldehyde dehydrogenase